MFILLSDPEIAGGYTHLRKDLALDEDANKKLVDAATVTAKSIGYTLLASGCGRALYPAFYNRLWREQRDSRRFRDALEESGASLDFGVKVVPKGSKSKFMSPTGASWHIGCGKWELAYHLVRHGTCSFGETRAEIVR